MTGAGFACHPTTPEGGVLEFKGLSGGWIFHTVRAHDCAVGVLRGAASGGFSRHAVVHDPKNHLRYCRCAVPAARDSRASPLKARALNPRRGRTTRSSSMCR